MITAPSSPSVGRRRLLLSSVAVIGALIFTGCAGGTGTEGSDAGGGTLTIGLEAEPPCLDPHQVAQTYALDVTRQTVDSLTEQDPETGEILPWLAESWTVNDDATEYEFVLREDATFSDGSPVDAAAVVANFDDLTTLSESYGTSFIRDLDSYEAVDERTVVFRFATSDAQFLQATSLVKLGMISPKTIEEKTPEERCAGELIGSGPFVYDEIDAQQSITLKKRADYAWPSPLSDNTGEAHLDSVEFQIIPESGVRNGSLMSNQIDVDGSVAEQNEEGLAAAGIEVVSAPARGLANALVPNEESAIWGDVDLRRAVSLAIDRSQISDVLPSTAHPATSVFTSATTAYTDKSSLLKTDLEAAEALLEDAGWEMQQDGIRAKDGVPLQLRVVLRADPVRQSVLEIVQQQLVAVGIDLQIDVQDAATATESETAGNYDFLFWSASRNEPDVLKNFFDPAGKNPIRRAADDSEFTTLLDSISATVDAEKRAESVDAFVTLLLTDAHVVPLFESAASFGVADTVEGFSLDAANRPMLQQVSRVG